MKKSRFQRYITLSLLIISTIVLLLSLNSCKHKHSFGEPVVVKPSTCIAEGQQEEVCECGVILESKIPTSDHVGGEWVTVTEATCISTGMASRHCQTCGVILEHKQIPATGHSMTAVEAKEATCAELGYNAHEVCSVCSYSTKKETPKLPHTPGNEPDCVNAQLCTVCSAVIKPALGHDEIVTPGIPATCTDVGLTDKIECRTCGQTVQEQIEIPERAHVLTTVAMVEPTCSRKGRTECQKCIVCDTEVIKSSVLPTTKHTYTDDKDNTCDVCGKVRLTGCTHQETTVIGNTLATCSKYGLSSGVACANTKCDHVIESPYTLDPDEHKPLLAKGFAATSSKPGLTNGVYCGICFTLLVAQEVIPAGDTTSPDIITLDTWLIGGEAESVILERNDKILNALSEKSYKVTNTIKTTTTYDYGGKKTESVSGTFIFQNRNWSTTVKASGKTAEVVFYNDVLYVALSDGNGNTVYRKMASPAPKDVNGYVKFDCSNTELAFFKKVTFETSESGDTVFNCSKLKSESDSFINGILLELYETGTPQINEKKTYSEVAVNSQSEITSKKSVIVASVTTNFLGKLEVQKDVSSSYEYGDYTVSAPENIGQYEEVKSFSKLFS